MYIYHVTFNKSLTEIHLGSSGIFSPLGLCYIIYQICKLIFISLRVLQYIDSQQGYSFGLFLAQLSISSIDGAEETGAHAE